MIKKIRRPKSIERLVILTARALELSNVDFIVLEQDDRSVSSKQIDLEKLFLTDGLLDGEKTISRNDKLKRLKGLNCIRLDVAVAISFFKSKKCLRWLEKKGIVYLEFLGTIFQYTDRKEEYRTDGDTFVVSIEMNGAGHWVISTRDFFFNSHPGQSSACLQN